MARTERCDESEMEQDATSLTAEQFIEKWGMDYCECCDKPESKGKVCGDHACIWFSKSGKI